MNDFLDDKDAIRRKVIGLGEESLSKSYYPQLQQHINELQKQKKELESKTEQLNQTIHDLQATKALLEESENRFRSLFENANDAIYIFNTSHECVDCNSKGLELLHYIDKSDLISINPIELAPEYQLSGELSFDMGTKFLQKAWNGEPQIFDWIILRKNNTKAYCEVSLNCIAIGKDKFLQAIVRDITKFKKLEHDISMATIRTEEKERFRFAKELHDGIGPILSTIKLYMQWLEDTSNKEHIEVIKKKINESIIEATKAIKEISHNLSPHVLTNYGLIEAIGIFIDKIRATGKLEIQFKHNIKDRLNGDLESMFYRVITELINNTLIHAQATKSSIELIQKDHILYFYYSDDGKGFKADLKIGNKIGMGLNNIKNRVKSVGGTVELNTSQSKGFNIKIVIINNLII